MKNLIGWVAMLLPVFVSAQSAILKGKIINLSYQQTKMLLVEQWDATRWRFIDSIPLNSAGYFEKRVQAAEGQSRIRLWGQPKAWVEFIYPKKDSVLLDFGFIQPRTMSGNVAFLEEEENAFYFKMLSEWRKCQIKLDSLRAAKIAAPDSQLADLRAAEVATQRQLNAFFKKISVQKKGMFIADVVAQCWQFVIPEDYPNDATAKLSAPNIEFFRAHFLDAVPFRDARLLRFNGSMKILNDFRDQFFEKNDSSQQHFIDLVMQRRSGTEAVDLWLFEYLLDHFLDSKNDVALTYLLKWYAPDCSSDDSHVPNHLKNLVLALQKCEVGKPAFQIGLKNQDGKLIDFQVVAKENKLTLLFFWRISCSHCAEFKPQILSLYEKYRRSGFEVVAVCLDKNQEDWKNYLQANPTNWQNVWLDDAQREIFYQNYPIPGTPTLLSLDAQFRIHRRLVGRAALSNYLSDFFGF